MNQALPAGVAASRRLRQHYITAERDRETVPVDFTHQMPYA